MMNDSKQDSNNNKGKKRRRADEAFAKAYDGVKFTPIPSTGRPGTPHRYFRESYQVEFLQQDEQQQGEGQQSFVPSQIVHSHVNGLAVVTAGNVDSQSSIKAVQVLVQQANVASQSAGSKRKQKAKMLRGQAVSDAVYPRDALATITITTGKDADAVQQNQLRCCVWGSVLEINPNLGPQLLNDDPLVDGYVAVILPSGRFPPPLPQEQEDESLEKEQPETKAPNVDDATDAGASAKEDA